MQATRCSIDGCEKPRHGTARTCSMHEYRLRTFGTIDLPPTIPNACTVEGCEGGIYMAKGLCRTHYSRMKRTGTTDPRPLVEEDFWARVEKGDPDDCWLWIGSRNPEGYGRIGKKYAHRIACERAHGPAPTPDTVTRHSCDNPPCVNPAHISWGSQSQNVKDAYDRGRR